MLDNPRRRQHLVSKGYQRNFADGARVAVIDAHSGAVLDPRRHISENWRVDDFISVVESDCTVDDSLEREFAERERTFLNVVREITVSTPVTADQKTALDDLAAVHLTRSHSFEDAHRAVVPKALKGRPSQLARDPRTAMIFTRQYGRAPRPGELEAIVAAATDAFASDPGLFPSSIRRVDSGIRQLLAKWTIQLAGSADGLPGFVLPDNPVLHGRRAEGRFGFQGAGAVGDADMIIVPISRHLVAFYSGRPSLTSRQLVLNIQIRTKNSVLWINSLLVRSARSEVACHPGDAKDVSRLIGNLDRYPPNRFDTIRIH